MACNEFSQYFSNKLDVENKKSLLQNSCYNNIICSRSIIYAY